MIKIDHPSGHLVIGGSTSAILDEVLFSYAVISCEMSKTGHSVPPSEPYEPTIPPTLVQNS